MNLRPYLPFVLATAATLPGVAFRLAEGLGLAPWYAPAACPALMACLSGLAVLGASFLLLWACDAAQADISQTMALAVVALIAVLPEYAVDMYFTWQAGADPASNYSHYAIANMTGANRLLIGVAWGLIALLYWLRFKRDVQLESERRTELLLLGLATGYAFVVAIKGTLAWYDGCVFLAIYVWYIVLASRRPVTEAEAEGGPAEVLLKLSPTKRRLAVAGIFLIAAVAIMVNAKPFCEGLIHTGMKWGVNEFLLVQWLAPIASEAPEFIVALVFAWRGAAGTALGSLLSAKLNQWTLLVGMIPGVFALAHGWSAWHGTLSDAPAVNTLPESFRIAVAHSIPMASSQMHEILLTAAQSLLAVILLASMRLTISGALLLFGLFLGQLLTPSLLHAHPAWQQWFLGLPPNAIHQLFSLCYVVAAAAILLQAPRHVLALWRGLKVEPRCACEQKEPPRRLHIFFSSTAIPFEPRSSSCQECPLRHAALKAADGPAEDL